MRAFLPLLGLLIALPAPLLLPSPAAAHPVAPLPAFVRPAPVPLDSLPPSEQAGNGSYWLLIDNQEDLPSASSYGHYATKVLSEAGLQEASQISAEFEPGYQRVDWHRITLWRRGRATELLPRLKPELMRREQEWEWGLLDGRQTQLFSLEDVRVGDVVEYAYTLRGANPIFQGKASGRFYFRYQAPVERMAYRILHRPERKVHLQAREGAPDPVRGRAGNREELSWRLDKVPALNQDDDAPSWYDGYPHVQWGEYASWAEVADWALPLYRVEGKLSPELEEVVEGLRPLPPRERIRRALRLVQDDVRYLGLEMGVSSHRPTHPAKVYARRFGDCKDKTLLFCALMGRLGVEAAPVLVNSRGLRGGEDPLPSPLAFDHVIARIVFEGTFHYFDPTLTHQRGDPLASRRLAYGKGLAIVPGGSGFDAIDPDPSGAGSVTVDQALALPALDSAASLEVTSTYAGAEADMVRAHFATKSREEIAKDYLNYYARSFPAIAATAPIRYEDDTAANVVVLRESYRVDSLCAREEGTDGKGCGLYPQEAAHWVGEPERRIRTSPYGLAFPKHVRQSISLALPEAPEFVSNARAVAHPDFRFAWKERVEGKVVKLEYEYQALSDHVPLERFPAYLAALDTLEDHLGATLYPEGSGEGVWPLRRPNQFLFLFMLVSLGAGIRVARLVGRLPPLHPAPAGSPAREIRGAVLWFFGASLSTLPLVLAGSLLRMAFLLDQEAWNSFTEPGGGNYHPLWLPLLLADIFGALVAFVLSLAVLPLYFRRRRSFPGAAMALLALIMALSTLETFGFRLIPESQRWEEGPGGTAGWLADMAVCAMVIGYLVFSARVRSSFVHPLPEAPSRPEGPPPDAEAVAREKAAGREPAAS